MLYFAIFLFIGFFYNDARMCVEDMDKKQIPKDNPERKWADRYFTVMLIVGITMLLIPILYVIGWLWYFFCGGFLMWVDDAWYMKIVYGFISLIFLSILIGLFAILFGGWKPFK